MCRFEVVLLSILSTCLVLVLYVFDFLIVGSYKQLIAWCEMEMACELRLKDNGLLLGLVVWQVLYKVFLGQGLYKLQIMGIVKS